MYQYTGSNARGFVITNDKELKHTYREQCERLGVEWQDADAGSVKANSASGLIVTGTPASMARVPPQGIDPSSRHRIGTIRNYDQLLGELRRKKDAGGMGEWKAKYGRRSHENDTWSQQIGWRVRSLPPDAAQYGAGQRIEGEINDLMPSEGNEVEEKLGEVKAIALPSVLECLEKGTGITSGITPPDAAQYGAGQRIEEEINDLMPSEGNEVKEKLGEVKAIALPSVLECLEKGTGVASGPDAISGTGTCVWFGSTECIRTSRPFPTGMCTGKRLCIRQAIWNQNGAGRTANTETDPSG